MTGLTQGLIGAKVYDLGQPYYPGMPHFPGHPPFLFCLNKLHGEAVLSNGASSASETVTLGGHVGTRIDALAHFSCEVTPQHLERCGVLPEHGGIALIRTGWAGGG